jgi:hypothetical protein
MHHAELFHGMRHAVAGTMDVVSTKVPKELSSKGAKASSKARAPETQAMAPDVCYRLTAAPGPALKTYVGMCSRARKTRCQSIAFIDKYPNSIAYSFY